MIIRLAYPAYCQDAGENLFDNSYVHTIKFNSSYNGIVDSLESNYVMSYNFLQQQIRNVPYIDVSIQIDGNRIDNIGMRYKGYNSWWRSVKKPIKVDINEFVSGQKYDGLKKFNLHNGSGDPTMMRENLCYRLMNEIGINAPRTSFAEVYFDDTYMGLYRLVEQIDNTYLDVRFGSHEGNLYKQDNPGSGGYDLGWLGDSPSDYSEQLELKNHRGRNNWTKLIQFINIITSTSDENFKDSISDIFDVEEYLQILALDITLNNLDFYGGSARNYYLYEDVSGDKKIHWLPWDYNLTWADNAPDINIDPANYNLLIHRVLQVPEYYSSFIEKYCPILDYFNTSFLDTVIGANSSLIRPYLVNDEYLDFPLSAFDQNINTTYINKIGLYEFLNQRNTNIRSSLSALGYNCDSLGGDDGSIDDEVSIYPNPTNGLFKINADKEISEIVVINTLGQIVYQDLEANYTAEVIDLTSHPTGVYFIKIVFPGKGSHKTAIVKR